MSFCGFRPALHVPLGSRVDVASRGGGEICTIVSASGAACPTVFGGQLQVWLLQPESATDNYTVGVTSV